MVNTRAKVRKIQNIINLWFSEAAMADSNHLPTESGALIGSNDDLLIEILRRLPVTSVLRFKSVSKHWRSVLSHRRFTLLYNNESSSPGLFALNLYIPFDIENRSTPGFRYLDFFPERCGVRIVQSCNGLLLCCSYRGDERVRKYYVFNPTTKQFAVIPSVLGGMAVRESIYFMGLAFHQTDCVHYKLVCFHRANHGFHGTKPDDVFNIQIYSSDTGKWKISDALFTLSTPYYASFNYIVYWNQAIYWAPCCVNPLYFKLDTEELQSLPLPLPIASDEGYESGDCPLYFGESRGHLHLVETADRSSNFLHLNVYEMLSDHSGWFLKYRVELDELSESYPEMILNNLDPSSRAYYHFEVFDVVRGEEEDEIFMVIRIPKKIIRYNVADKSFKQISDRTYLYGLTGTSEVHSYVESLAKLPRQSFFCSHQLPQQSFTIKKEHLKYPLRLSILKPLQKAKMVNTRTKLQKINNSMKLCLSEAAMADSDQLATKSGHLIGSNDDLLMEILLRLPVTSVLRFKSVSKHWRSLLSHRNFTLLYKTASNSPGLFVRNLYIPFDVDRPHTPPFRNLDFYPDLCGIRIVQSCNGLLLCCSKRGHERARKYYVFNPTTKQFALIPSVPGGMDVRKTIRFMGLAFHQTDCAHYKVICIHVVKPDDLFKIQVYSSDTGKWKISDQSFSAPYYTPLRCGVFVNQAIYWAPSSANPCYFKIDTQELQSLPLPVPVASFGGYQGGALPLYFGESRGHLHLVERANRSDNSHLQLNVYEMLNDHSGWFLKYRVELDEFVNAYPEMINSYQDPSSPRYYEFEVFDVVRGKEDDETFVVIKVPGKIIRYNIVDKSFKRLFDLINVHDISYGRIGHLDVHRYIENLASF
ncbi:hypothetical protein LXL04_035344 [Taraxacum kok-saghyz]